MNVLLNKLYRMRLFSIDEVAEVGGVQKGSAVKLLTRLQQQGFVRQIRRNLYCVIDLASGLPVPDCYSIGSALSSTAVIAYHSALAFHGLAHQSSYNVYVMSDSRFNGFRFEDYDFCYCSNPIGDMEVVSPQGNPFVRVTSLERTLVDCIDRIDKAEGIEELCHCMEGVVLVDEGRMVQVLEAYGKAFLYQKVGYLLGRIQTQARISKGLIKLCHDKAKGHVKLLTNDEQSDTFVKDWHLYVPRMLADSREGYELV